MIVSSTELQNNFGKYVMLASQEDIIVTRNGHPLARLSAIRDGEPAGERRSAPNVVMESASRYSTDAPKATYEQFLELTRDTEDRYEYIDGHIYLLSSPKTTHQYALGELFGLFYSWFQGKPCRPFIAPFDIELRRSADNINVVQPDLMVICDLEQHLGEDDYYKGVPSLLVEILSESTRRKDLIAKLDLYMSTGVKEYWILNPISREIAVYEFADGNIRRSVTYKNGETAASFIFPGLGAELSRVFRP